MNTEQSDLMTPPPAPPSITRTHIVDVLRQAFDALPAVLAAWEGGSAAFGRVDAWSDVDAVAVVADEAVDATFAAAEQALETLSPIAQVHRVAGTSGFRQRFYRLRDAGEFAVVDLVLIRRSDPLRFREVELHGRGPVWKDPQGLLVDAHLDAAADAASARERVDALASAFAMFQHLVTKDRLRGRAVDALAFYQAYTMRPLIEALRLLHAPHTRVFGPRYVGRDLPAPAVRELERLSFVHDLADLAVQHAAACRWFDACLARLQASGPGSGLEGLTRPPS